MNQEPSLSGLSTAPYPAHYAAARAAFRDAAGAAGARLEAHAHPHATGPAGEDLTIDIAFLGDERAPAALLSISGTHGLEAFSGSAVQAAFLRNLSPPDGCRIMMVHGLNPYGMAWNSRTNENNVDLSRNFIRFGGALPENEHYGRVHEFFALDQWGDDAKQRLEDGFNALLRAVGPANALTGVTGGQYSHPDGLNYGGREPAWSRRVFEAACTRLLGDVRRVAYLDFHSGFGAFGEPFFVCMHPEGSAERARAERWWGPINRTEDAFELDATPSWQGLLWNGLTGWIVPEATVTGAVVEFGTYSKFEMGEAVMIDRWLRFGDGR
ncbi:MAG: hypothetical protein JWM77_3425, partial [Rhodospirillales bacterium]|nr:hypothetical protein [Rhodospirillales bacterium]